MKLQFNLEYFTNYGEQLELCVLGDEKSQPHAMTTLDGHNWILDINGDALRGKNKAYVDYYYRVCIDKKERRHEWLVRPHRLEFAALKGVNYTVYDHWLDIPDDAYMYSSAFTECIAARERALSAGTEFLRTVRLKVRASQLRAGQHLALVGAAEYLGAWDYKRALPMTEHEYNEWVISLDADRVPSDFEFKFIILDNEKNVQPVWEESANRCLHLPDMERNAVVVYELPHANFAVYPWKGAGTVIPVFSLRSEGSFGVGDFGDLKQMVNWSAKTQQRVLQVLPINDTTINHTWQDSYPYNAISIYALHPQYMDLRQLPELKDKEQRERFEALRQELNALPQIDYERMMAAKIEYMQRVFAQEGTKLKRTTAYKEFVERNKEWLEPYARFCFYRDLYGTATFSQWPKKLAKPEQKVLDFWFFVQYHLDAQMRSTHEHARQQRVVLKGDIPIGISRDGVEAWVEPRYFNMNGQTGAPPDAFAEDGQNWGFPTYNWDEMLKDDCAWWVRRFRKMQEYFDAYRIDHVLGFFRIWEIPMPHKSGLYGQFQPSLGMTREEVEAYGVPFREELFLKDHKREGFWHPRINAVRLELFKGLSEDEQNHFWHLYNDYFYRRNNQFWYQEAMKKLPRLTQATRMLCCAEDLGMVPECVPWVMNQLCILTLEIQSMPKEPNLRFGKLSHNPYRSVCTISTHDMPTLRQWWDEDEERTQQYYSISLRRADGIAPHPLPGWLAKDIISRNLTSPSMLCLLSLQDWLAIDEKLRLPDPNAERINIPANPRHYWRYRMHLTIEQLMQADDFNSEIVELIMNSGRK